MKKTILALLTLAGPAYAAEPSGTVVGTITARGGSVQDGAVYVADVRTKGGATSATVRQVSKQFTPRVLVVPRGTKVEFPNQDPIFHNVFSLSPGNAFDLGMIRAGDRAQPVTLSRPGVVKVFCNIHPTMSATVLVTPSPLFVRPAANGSFRLDKVPAGKRKIGAWMPEAEPVVLEVDVQPGKETKVSFTLEPGRPRPHLNKEGKPYGSYRE